MMKNLLQLHTQWRLRLQNICLFTKIHSIDYLQVLIYVIRVSVVLITTLSVLRGLLQWGYHSDRHCFSVEMNTCFADNLIFAGYLYVIQTEWHKNNSQG